MEKNNEQSRATEMDASGSVEGNRENELPGAIQVAIEMAIEMGSTGVQIDG